MTEIDGEWKHSEKSDGPGEERAIWEVYAHDLDECEIFTRNLIRIMNREVEIRGWIGWLRDMFGAVRYGIGL